MELIRTQRWLHWVSGSHGPQSSDDIRNIRRRLDTFSSPEDEQSRSAVLLRSPCEQYHKGITKWIDNLWEESNVPAYNKPVRIHCKAGSVLVRLVFETRAKCQDFIARYKDDAISYAINSPFCCTNTNIIVRQSKSIEDREIGKQFAPLWRELAHQLKVLFPDGDDDGAFIIPALENRCSNLLFLEADKHLPLLHLSCLFLVFLLKCCNVFSLKPTGLMCDGRSLASPLFRRLAGRGAFFSGFPFRWVLHFVFYLIRGVALHESPSCSGEDCLGEYGRPCDPLSCFLFSALWLRCNQSLLVQETQSHVLRRSCFPCPWIGLLIFLADSILPDPRFLLMFPAANINSMLRHRFSPDPFCALAEFLFSYTKPRR